MTATLFLEWMLQCFIPETKKYLDKENLPYKVLLLIDNVPGHPEDCATCGNNVEVIFFPKNTTSLIQPLDQGIIKCMKTEYTYLTMKMIRDVIDANPDIGIMDQWKRFTIGDAITFTAEAVNAIAMDTINAC